MPNKAHIDEMKNIATLIINNDLTAPIFFNIESKYLSKLQSYMFLLTFVYLKFYIYLCGMIITSKIIIKNLESLEYAKVKYPILTEYTDYNEYSDRIERIKNMCNWLGLQEYLNFIEFKDKMLHNEQNVFYNRKISFSELKTILSKYATNCEAEIFFKNMNKKSFITFINSDKVLSRPIHPDEEDVRYNYSIWNSYGIIANYLIQNKIDIVDINSERISTYYTKIINKPDILRTKEIENTKYLLNELMNTFSNHDLKRINYSFLMETLKQEIKDKMIKTINIGETVKCINNLNHDYVTIGKNYIVIHVEVFDGSLFITIKTDNDSVRTYTFKMFESISEHRNLRLKNILENN
jgi:hypothetical protein